MSERPDMGEVQAIFAGIPHVLRAPWTADQVEKLNEFQRIQPLHPFTCNGGRLPNEHAHETEVLLVAEQDGWHCPECGYTQDWCWPFMAEGES